MAEHPEGYPLEAEQALLVVCSTQAGHPISPILNHAIPFAMHPSYHHASLDVQLLD